jgi:hypothetical protein
MTPDIPPKYQAPNASYDYVKREAMIPMRDGVKLFTVIVVPRGAKNASMILTRTPYNAAKRAERFRSPHMLATLPQGDEVFAAEGYIRVFQDVRGKYGSEGDYVTTRPLKGALNSSATDHSTDAYDTIDWLVKNVPESNGKVGMLGVPTRFMSSWLSSIHPGFESGSTDGHGGWLDGRRWVSFECVSANDSTILNRPRREEKGTRSLVGDEDYDNFWRRFCSFIWWR